MKYTSVCYALYVFFFLKNKNLSLIARASGQDCKVGGWGRGSGSGVIHYCLGSKIK